MPDLGAYAVWPDFGLKKALPRRLIAFFLDDRLSQKVATIAGAGISINSLWSINRELIEGSLVRILPEYTPNDHSALWLVYPKSNLLTAKFRVFIDFF